MTQTPQQGQGVCRMSACALVAGHWLSIRGADPRARALMRRHYSARRYRDGRNPQRIVGPGEYMALLTLAGDALFIWRKFRPADGQEGVNCAVFRNEGTALSSELIREACELAWQRWPGARLYTYVNPRRVRSRNPGYCFLCAGWRRCGRSKGGLVILEVNPPDLS